MAKLVDATAYLLERTGDVKGAFKLTLDVSCWSCDSHVTDHTHFRLWRQNWLNSVTNIKLPLESVQVTIFIGLVN